MEMNAALAAVVDDLCEQHSTFKRTTIERLVIRTFHDLGDAPVDATMIDAITAAANEQLSYVEGVDPERPVRRSG